MSFQQGAMTLPDGAGRPPRRFSEGMERMPLAPSSWRVGRFSDGLASLPLSASAKRIGSFADGLVLRPDASSTRRVGSFGDGLEREGGDSPTVSRVDSQRSTVENRIAA